MKGMDFGSDNVSMAGEHWLAIGMGFGSENVSLTWVLAMGKAKVMKEHKEIKSGEAVEQGLPIPRRL